MESKENEQELYQWCVEQAVRYETGQMSDEEFKKLQDIDFPFEHYSKEADKLVKAMGLDTNE